MNGSKNQFPDGETGGALWRDVFARLPVPTVLIDAAGAVTQANAAFADLLGYDTEECVRLTIDRIVMGGYAPPHAEAARSIEENAPAQQSEQRLVRKDGETVWALMSASPLTHVQARPNQFIIQAIDITRQKGAEAALRLLARRNNSEDSQESAQAPVFETNADAASLKSTEAKLQFANTLLMTQMETSPDGILVVDANARIISFNHRFADMWGVSLDLLEAKDDAPVLKAVMSSMKDPQAFVARVRYLYEHPEEGGRDELETKDGRFIDRHTGVLRTPSGEQLGRVWFFRDITDHKLAEAEILRSARCDALTGLANRAVFMEAVQREIARAKRGAKSFGVLYLDLDQFKDVNDTLGHPVGDELLKAVAARLCANTRSADLVARFGGDEFAVMVTDISEQTDAAVIANTIIVAMDAPFVIEGNDIHSGVSIGISLFGADEPDKETILSRADIALYRAKSERLGGYRFHTDAMDHEIRTRVALGSELREGIALGQLFLEYQPQVNIATRRITGVEALVRWRHPSRGVIAPNVFIPVAEKSGLIAMLGHWVLREACAQAKSWLDAGIAPEVIAVNLSALQFKRAFELEREIAHVLAETGLPASRLELELTETVLMAASREHNDCLQRLRESGVRLAIDDFGVGYSSLDYLRRFPANRIKIAQAFVGQITGETGSAAIVKATIGLARELGIVVVAEGVETAAQLDLLKRWDCPEAQGFYFARPLAAADVAPLFVRGRIVGRAKAFASSAA
jgi:diguanylate cyclase (GGDEF)-like protein/PAS domain S-box-containing protein